MKYVDFVKAEMAKVKHIAPKERMKEIGKRWRQKGGGSDSKAQMSGGAVKAPKKRIVGLAQPGIETQSFGRPAMHGSGYGKTAANEMIYGEGWSDDLANVGKTVASFAPLLALL